MKLLILFTSDVSLRLWDKIGIIHREISLYKNLSKKGVDITFLTYGDEKDYIYKDLLENINIIPVYDYLRRKLPIFNSIFLFLKLRKILNQFDIIKSNQIDGSFVACLAKLFLNKKIIIRAGYDLLRNFLAFYELGGEKKSLRYYLTLFKIYLIEFIALKLADKIIYSSESDIEFIIKTYKFHDRKNKIHHFYNYIDTNLFKPLNEVKKDKSILFIGKLYFVKNLNNLIKAFKNLKNFSLTIIGDGPDKENLKKLAFNYMIDIKFLNIIPNNQLWKFINKHEIFILPSLFEGNPKVLLEAMSCGLACIGTNVRGINDIIEHKKTGYLCSPNYISIKNSIQLLYHDKNLMQKIGKNARKFIENNCSLDIITDKEMHLYNSILKSK